MEIQNLMLLMGMMLVHLTNVRLAELVTLRETDNIVA